MLFTSTNTSNMGTFLHKFRMWFYSFYLSETKLALELFLLEIIFVGWFGVLFFFHLTVIRSVPMMSFVSL